MSNTLEGTDANFDDVVAASKPTIVIDFWADWCGPCKALSPVLDDLASDFHDCLSVIKVNIERSPETTKQFRVMSVPTLVVLHDGEPVKTLRGSQTKSELVAELSGFLKKA